MSAKSDYYHVLGVDKNANAAEIKAAYRKLALKWHPDRNKTKEAEAKFKEINEAYEILSSPEKKSKYDQFGHAAFGQGGNPFSGQNPFGGYYSTGNINLEDLFGSGGFSDPFDVFSAFFGGSPFGSQSKYQARPRYQLKVSFMDAIKGAEKTITHQGKEYQVKIPAGIDEGTKMRYTDFDVIFQITPHPHFNREGYDCIIDQEIPLSFAVLGGDVVVPTLDGDLKVKVKAGTKSGSIIRLSGKGIKHLQSSKRGDFYIRFIINIPTKLSSRQKELFRELKEEGV